MKLLFFNGQTFHILKAKGQQTKIRNVTTGKTYIISKDATTEQIIQKTIKISNLCN
jgi:hypothetical protein